MQETPIAYRVAFETANLEFDADSGSDVEASAGKTTN